MVRRQWSFTKAVSENCLACPVRGQGNSAGVIDVCGRGSVPWDFQWRKYKRAPRADMGRDHWDILRGRIR